MSEKLAFQQRFRQRRAVDDHEWLVRPATSLVQRAGETNSGATEIFQPWGDAVAEAT